MVVDGDSEDISTLKITGLAFLEDKFNPHILHKAAVFFNPRQKSMKVLSVADRAAVLEYVNDELDQLPLRPVIDTEPQDDAHQPPKRQRIDEFDDDVIEQQAVNEIEMYTNTPTPNNTEPLVWWRENSSKYPGLSSISRNTLSVMATSAASERNFSLAGYVVSARRSSIKGANVNNILLIHSSLKK